MSRAESARAHRYRFTFRFLLRERLHFSAGYIRFVFGMCFGFNGPVNNRQWREAQRNKCTHRLLMSVNIRPTELHNRKPRAAIRTWINLCAARWVWGRRRRGRLAQWKPNFSRLNTSIFAMHSLHHVLREFLPACIRVYLWVYFCQKRNKSIFDLFRALDYNKTICVWFEWNFEYSW